MIKKNRWKLLISSLIILLPAVFGLLFWNDLPMEMTTHWGLDGRADGVCSRVFSVLGMPALILFIHWVCVFFAAKDPGNREQNQKVFSLVIWITPLISLLTSGVIYASAFGWEFSSHLFLPLLMGAVFAIIGNYLPKCRQNYTIGIKIKWTLENEENWNATHRFGGKMWLFGGILLMLCAFLPETPMTWAVISLMILLVVIPIIYSYLYHRKQLRNGTAVITPIGKTKTGKISIVMVVVILVLCAWLLFSGEIRFHFGETALSIESSFWSDLTVDYDVIESIEYRESDSRGMRTFGLGSARLLAGTFHNEEFGTYTRYSYTGCDACVVVKAGGKDLVLSDADEASTKKLYETLQLHMQ